jgi:hypothetical protein
MCQKSGHFGHSGHSDLKIGVQRCPNPLSKPILPWTPLDSLDTPWQDTMDKALDTSFFIERIPFVIVIM